MDSVNAGTYSPACRSLALETTMSTSSVAAARAFRAGRLSEASLLLERSGVRSIEDGVMLAELLYLGGQSSRAIAEAEARLSEPLLGPELKSRCLSLVAALAADDGNLDAALVAGRNALALADQASDSGLWATTAALLLERSCDQTGFDAALPMAAQVRRHALRCPDLQVRANVHLTFGRLEARVGHLHTALRHFAVARQLTLEDPNQLIASSIDLDESSVLSLLGDIPGALEMAQRATRSATASGWAKGKRVAAQNVAQLLVSLGRLSEVDSHIQLAAEQTFQSVTIDVALADTRAQLAYCREQYGAAEETLSTAERLGNSVPQWPRLTNHVTRNRLLIRLGRFHEAVDRATECLAAAEMARAGHLATAFRLQRAEALLALNLPEESSFLATSPTMLSGLPLSVVGAQHLVAAKALLADGARERGGSRLGTAMRVLEQAGDKPAEVEARLTAGTGESRVVGTGSPVGKP